MDLSALPDQPDDRPAPDVATYEGIVDPFQPIIEGGIDLIVPPEFPDAYIWVAYTVDGRYYSEAARDEKMRRWHTLDVTNVTFLDLVPVPVYCEEHAGNPAWGCPRCMLGHQRSKLQPHRLMVPPGGAAHFERRRDREAYTNRLAHTWTVVGWTRSFLSVRPLGLKIADMGARNVEVSYYVFLDDLGRSFYTSDLQQI